LQAETFGLSLLGDGATVKRMPLVNMLAAGVHEPAGVFEIAECTGHIQDGGKKDYGFIAGLFFSHMTKNDRDKQLIDCAFFDRASNVQKAGKIIQVHYPRVVALHGVEYVQHSSCEAPYCASSFHLSCFWVWCNALSVCSFPETRTGIQQWVPYLTYLSISYKNGRILYGNAQVPSFEAGFASNGGRERFHISEDIKVKRSHCNNQR
jgi:hypothetical protein